MIGAIQGIIDFNVIIISRNPECIQLHRCILVHENPVAMLGQSIAIEFFHSFEKSQLVVPIVDGWILDRLGCSKVDGD